MAIRVIKIISVTILLASCGGGSSSSEPVPSISLSASSASVEVGGEVNVVWSASDANSCTASNGWSGSKGSSGTEPITLDALGSTTFTLTCVNSSGSTVESLQLETYRTLTGVVVDGYITGSTVFSDNNGNLTLDTDEESVTSASDGSFSLNAGSGNVVSVGGFDADMSSTLDDLLLVSPVSDSQSQAVVSPLTTIASFMEDPIELNAVLGIDPSIDLLMTDPVAKKGTSPEYDLLYEKGNQLTVLAYSLQSTAGDSASASADAFSSITKVLEESYAETQEPPNIESKGFISDVIDQVDETTQSEIPAERKANIATALASVLPLIQVREATTTNASVLNFATTTLISDIEKIADGTASNATIAQYDQTPTAYIAEAQGGNAADYAPTIKALDDAVTVEEDTDAVIDIVANDDYLDGSPAISIELDDASYGSLVLGADNKVTYTPVSNYTGEDTFKYTLVQGNKRSTGQVTITVSPVADAPKFSLASNAVSLAENSTAVGTFAATDADDDTLSYSLSGTDADKFSISETGELSLTAAADYETQTSYSVIISASDGSESVSESITIGVSNLIETPPSLTLPSTISVAENTSVVAQASATDPEGSALTYALSGTDAATFYVSSSGLVSFRAVPDYESLTKTQYSLTVTVTNAGALSSSGSMTVNVTDIPENFFDTCRFGECRFE